MDGITLKHAIYGVVRAYNAANGVNYNAETLTFHDGYMGMTLYRLGKRAMAHLAIEPNGTYGADILILDEANEARPLLDAITAETGIAFAA